LAFSVVGYSFSPLPRIQISSIACVTMILS
jgi:hypothetical protein